MAHDFDELREVVTVEVIPDRPRTSPCHVARADGDIRGTGVPSVVGRSVGRSAGVEDGPLSGLEPGGQATADVVRIVALVVPHRVMRVEVPGDDAV